MVRWVFVGNSNKLTDSFQSFFNMSIIIYLVLLNRQLFNSFNGPNVMERSFWGGRKPLL
jgi:hypothetical protein